LALAATGCGYDLSADEAGRPHPGRDVKVDWSTDEDVASRLHIVPIARTAIQQRFVHAKISDVACASTHMYVSARRCDRLHRDGQRRGEWLDPHVP